MTLRSNAHPEGFYPDWPAVTWDLAEERWLTRRNGRPRVVFLLAKCSSCGWSRDIGAVALKRERILTEEFIAKGQHAYSGCPDEAEVGGITPEGELSRIRLLR